jgi:hypothetical protein
MKRIKLKDILLEQMDGYSVAQAKDEIEKDKEWEKKNEEYTNYIKALSKNYKLQRLLNWNQFYFPIGKEGFDPTAVNVTEKSLNQLLKNPRYNFTGETRKGDCNDVIQYLISLYKEITGRDALKLIDQDIKSFWSWDGKDPANYELCIPENKDTVEGDWENNLTGYMKGREISIKFNKGEISFKLGAKGKSFDIEKLIEEYMQLYRFRTVKSGWISDSYEYDHKIGFKLNKLDSAFKAMPTYESFQSIGLNGNFSTRLEYNDSYSNLIGTLSGNGTMKIIDNRTVKQILNTSSNRFKGPKRFKGNTPKGKLYANKASGFGIFFNINSKNYLFCKSVFNNSVNEMFMEII